MNASRGIPHIIFSYPGEYARFVEHCGAVIRRYLGPEKVFHYTDGAAKLNLEAFAGTLDAWADAGVPIYMVFLCHERHLVNAQDNELQKWQALNNRRSGGSQREHTLFVEMPLATSSNPPKKELTKPISKAVVNTATFEPNPYIEVTDIDQASAERLAEYLLRIALTLPPKKHACKAFTYEKDIISFYADLYRSTEKKPFVALPASAQQRFIKQFDAGVPMIWPSIRVRTDRPLQPNPRLAKIGAPRKGIVSLASNPQPPAEGREDGEKENTKWVSVSALAEPGHADLRFLEAGPRSLVGRFRKVGVVVSGGIAPGINAVIDGIVQRHREYDPGCIVHGFTNGFFGLSQNQPSLVHLYPQREDFSRNELCEATSEHVSTGGSLIGTYRLDRLDTDDEPGGSPGEANHNHQDPLSNITHTLADYDALYVIGGDGSMKMANMLLARLRRLGTRLTVVGIPKTMDNDILWVWQSFGFATAVEKAREVIDCLSVEKNSNPRVCIVQLFGSVSGFVVSHAVLACRSAQCDAALIPEAEFSIESVAKRIKHRVQANKGRIIPDGLIVMAETAIPKDWRSFASIAGLTPQERKSVDAWERIKAPDYLEGQTSDELRSAGLKLLQKGLEAELKKTFGEVVRVFTNEPRHILRASNPSFSDIIFGQRLGSLAVDNALAGYGDFMVSQWLTEYVMVPLRLVSIGRKRIHKDGIFWKSVLAKTKQDDHP